VEAPLQVSDVGINPLSIEKFDLYGSGEVKFFDGAYICVHRIQSFSTVKITLSGHPSTEYQVWFTNTDTLKYIYGNGSSCSKYTIMGGSMYIQITPYNGGSNWVTAKIEVR